jgi:hypothetical protein
LVFLTVLSVGLPSRADADRVGADPAACTEARSIVLRDTAPCTGLLIPHVEALAALKCLSEKLPACKIAREADIQRAAAVKKSLDAQLLAERKRASDLQRLLNEATKVAPPEHPWWKSPVIWTVVGIAIGAASTYAILKLSEK